MNIYNTFKSEIGIANVTNELIELMYREFCAEHGELLSDFDKLREFSKRHKINLTQIKSENAVKISGLYIINIQSMFSVFLASFIGLPGAPTKALKERTNGEDMLAWVLKSVYPQGYDEDIECSYFICNYYRLMRNSLLHGKSRKLSNVEEKSLKKANLFFSENSFFRVFLKKLSAPNSIDRLSFDDQVLFSKAANNLAKRIYFDSTYDLRAHIQQTKDSLNHKLAGFTDRVRIEKYLYYYLDQVYPVRDEKYKEIMQNIITEYMEQGVLA